MKRTILVTNPELTRKHLNDTINLVMDYINKGVTIQDIVFNFELIKADLIDQVRFEDDDEDADSTVN